MDATHPPNRLRIAAIGAETPAADMLDGTESDAVDAELRAVIKDVTEDIRARAIG